MNYAYKARDAMGKTLEGSVEADDRDAASKSLQHDGLQVLLLEEADEGLQLFARGIKKNEVIYVTSQLSIMVDTGITLSQALGGIAEQEEHPTLRKMLNDIRGKVESGEDFSAALAQYPKYFDKTFVSLVKASEQTGSLGSMLDRIANYLRAQLESRAKVRAAMAYPGIMAVMAIGVTIFLLTFILPKFTPLFTRKGMKLPLPTTIMISLSHALLHYWYLWLIGIVAVAVAYFFGCRTELGRQILDGAKIHLPILGSTFRKVILSRSISTLGTMLQSGVSMLDALKLTAEVSGNYHYEKAWLHVVDEITQGNRICDSLRGNKLFPKTLVQMIGAGEDTGRLDYVLQKVSVYYDREVETSLKSATSLIEPIMISVMGVVVGGIGMGIMLPIFQLSRAGGH